ncbi:DEAD/DEAH box helicase [Desmospora profundinema]|uniref:DNA helicase n=1 Tax=Desmospora profundinema TaxID=1571184 RepID=A0ABU1ISI1_9BACL|nr:3'-5' exonuclease [Desmospora profundinema]MDR6226889.1 hypothetical protein [Desmospora profundinema]
MAVTIPETMPKKATAGETLLFRTLKRYLTEEYVVYYEPDIQGWRPDFVIIGPELGLLVLEVKDYTRSTLVELNPDQWTIRNGAGEEVTVVSPLKQARDYAFRIADKLKRDRDLVQTEGKHRSKLKFPFGYGVVFTRLTKADLAREELLAVVDPKLTLTREEIDPEREAFSEILLRQKLSRMFTVSFSLKEPLRPLDIQRIRFHLFPEVRIGGKVTKKVSYQDYVLLSLDDLETMDLHQESLAKQIGDKHRLIRGVAGSGKTLILASRAAILAREHPDWEILILCYNISLSRFIHDMVEQKWSQSGDGLDDEGEGERCYSADGRKQITVRHFHEWLHRDLKITEEEIPQAVEEWEAGKRMLPRYDAILIDEGQDFAPEWLGLASRLLNPDTQSLLIVEDRAQTIYPRRRSLRKDTGLDFRGRSRVLTINYRNTGPVVQLAWEFYQAHASPENKPSTGEDVEVITPQSTLRSGPPPYLKRFASLTDEMAYVARQMKVLHRQRETAWSDMLVLYRVKRYDGVDTMGVIQQALSREGIPFYWLTENHRSKRAFAPRENGVTISTIDSSKGLDFEAVFVVNLERLPFPMEENKEREVSLLYIAMTRAKKYLSLTWSGESEFTRWLEQAERTAVKQ